MTFLYTVMICGKESHIIKIGNTESRVSYLLLYTVEKRRRPQ